MNPNKKLLDTRETAERLGLGKSTLEQARLSGSLKLKYVRVGRLVRYREEDIEAYLTGLPAFEHTTAEEAAKRA